MSRYLSSRYFVLFLLLGIAIACKDKPSKKNNSPELEIVINKDSIAEGNAIRGVAYLKNSSFDNNEAKILVYVENSDEPKLKSDLSNIDDLNFYVFENFTKDSINQKYFRNYPKRRTAAFGRKFNTSGNKKIKGFVMEYYGFDPIRDLLKDKHYKRYYFEKNIYIQ